MRGLGVALFGPTSSGKTSLSLDVAARLRAEHRRPVVLNADSRQVYRYMDVGTSKIAAAEMGGVEHLLLDIVEPTRRLPLERYSADARAALAALATDDRAVPIAVGGTGTYVRAVVDAWDLSGTAATRRDLEREFPSSEVGEAHRMLRRIAPDAATRVSQRDYEGTVNALVRAMHPDDLKGMPTFEWTVVAVDRKPAELERRVAATLDHQLHMGLHAEVQSLDDRYALTEQFERRGVDAPNQVLHTHGYREFFEHARAHGRAAAKLTRMDLETVREATLVHIVAYTRRQRSWFKKFDLVRPPAGADAAKWIVDRLRV